MEILEVNYLEPVVGKSFIIFLTKYEKDIRNQILKYGLRTEYGFEKMCKLVEFLKLYDIDKMTNFEKRLSIDGVQVFVGNKI